jgi:hypothetical protein
VNYGEGAKGDVQVIVAVRDEASSDAAGLGIATR